MRRSVRADDRPSLRFEFDWADPSVGELLTQCVDLPSRPMVGNALLVTIDGGRGPVATKVYITEVMWRGVALWDKEEPVGTLTLRGSKP